MTFDGIFEKCTNLMELHMKEIELLKEHPEGLSQLDILRAYRKRREELRSKWKEHSWG